MVRRVIFMRHGQSEYNLHVQGDCESECGEDPLIRDAGLTALGCAQAEGRVAKRRGRQALQVELERLGVDLADVRVVSSPLSRAVRTLVERFDIEPFSDFSVK